MKNLKEWTEPNPTEWAKSAAIFLLTLSALFLATQVEVFSQLSLFFFEEETASSSSGNFQNYELSGTLLPQSMVAVTAEENAVQQFGVERQDEALFQFFDLSSQTLKEALGNANSPTGISQESFLSALETAPSLYYHWLGEIPLDLIGQWLSGESHAHLSGSVSRILLTAWQDGVGLLYEENGKYYAAKVDVLEEDRLEALLLNLSGENLRFAFQEEGLSQLHPLTIIGEQLPQAQIYTASTDFLEGAGQTELIEALGFPVSAQFQYQTDEEFVLRSGVESLRLSKSGRILYQTEGTSRYILQSGQEDLSLYEQVEGCRLLAQSFLENLDEPPLLTLHSVSQEKNALVIGFSATLAGLPLSFGGEREIATFILENDVIRSFSLIYRNYIPTEEETYALPLAQAQAILVDMGKSDGSLFLVYQDNAGDKVSIFWVTE